MIFTPLSWISKTQENTTTAPYFCPPALQYSLHMYTLYSSSAETWVDQQLHLLFVVQQTVICSHRFEILALACKCKEVKTWRLPWNTASTTELCCRKVAHLECCLGWQFDACLLSGLGVITGPDFHSGPASHCTDEVGTFCSFWVKNLDELVNY